MIDLNDPDVQYVIKRLDTEPSLSWDFQDHIRKNLWRDTQITSRRHRQFTPAELAFILAHWRMTR